MRIIELKQ